MYVKDVTVENQVGLHASSGHLLHSESKRV